MAKASDRGTPPESDVDVLEIRRHLDAPPALVYEAWTEPKHLIQWSAPHGFTVTHCDGDLRPGGFWRSCMRSPDGKDLWLGGTYREVVEGRRLVMTHAWDGKDGKPGHETLVTISFQADGSRTALCFRQEGFKSGESREGHRGGWEQSFDRLAEYLVSTSFQNR